MLPELDICDWEEVFKYATPDSVVGESVDTTPFSRDDVVQILHSEEGENDGPDWIVAGILQDGRYFVLRAGCDYTGWG